MRKHRCEIKERKGGRKKRNWKEGRDMKENKEEEVRKKGRKRKTRMEKLRIWLMNYSVKEGTKEGK